MARLKFCRDCPSVATHVELEDRPIVTVLRDGYVRHGVQQIARFYCKWHHG